MSPEEGEDEEEDEEEDGEGEDEEIVSSRHACFEALYCLPEQNKSTSGEPTYRQEFLSNQLCPWNVHGCCFPELANPTLSKCAGETKQVLFHSVLSSKYLR